MPPGYAGIHSTLSLSLHPLTQHFLKPLAAWNPPTTAATTMVVSKPSRMISSLQYPAASKLLCSNDLWSFQPSTSMVTSKDFSTQILIISLGLSDTSCKPSTLLHPHPGLICSNSPSPLPSDSSTFPQSLNQTAPHHGGMADHLDCRLWFLCTLTSHMT